MLPSIDQPAVRALRVLRPLKLVAGIESKSTVLRASVLICYSYKPNPYPKETADIT